MEKDFANNKIKEFRMEKDISQRELARLTGIKQADISRWEAGVVTPNIMDMWTLADFFGVSIDDLAGRTEI